MVNDQHVESLTASKKSMLEGDVGGGIGEADTSPTDSVSSDATGEAVAEGNDGKADCMINYDNNFQSLHWMKRFKFRPAFFNVCPVLVPSELLLSTHLPTSEGWTAVCG